MHEKIKYGGRTNNLTKYCCSDTVLHFLFFTIEFLRISTSFFKPDDKQVCDKYEFTTTAEVSDDDDDDDDEEYKKQKASRGKKGGKG
jgi:hypothetical protein